MPRLIVIAFLLLLPMGSAEVDTDAVGAVRAPFTSAEGVLLDFELDGRLVEPVASPSSRHASIATQLR